MNVAAHQEKKKNEKKGKRKLGEERKRATDFKEATCCPSAVVQEAALEKSGLCWGVPGVTEMFEKANSHFDPTQTGSGTSSPR